MPDIQTPPPAPPASVLLTVDVAGVKTAFDLSPEAIVVFNNFMHSMGHQGTFGERFMIVITNTIKQLAVRPEFAPSIKAKVEAHAIDVAKAAEDIAKPKGVSK